MAGFKDFQPAEVLTAADVNDFLMDQSVMVFDDAAARAAAIGTANFTEGMTTYNKDTAQLELFDGAAFVAVGAQPGLIHINTTTFSAVAAVNLNNIFSATFRTYFCVFSATASSPATMRLRMRVSGSDNSTANYQNQSGYFEGGGTVVGRTTNQTSWHVQQPSLSGDPYFEHFIITNPFAVANTIMTREIASFANTTNPHRIMATHGLNLTTSFDGISFFMDSNNMTGTVRIYGLAN